MNQKRMMRRPPPPVIDPTAPSAGKAIRGILAFVLITGMIGWMGWKYYNAVREEAVEEDEGISHLESIGQELWAQGVSTRIQGDKEFIDELNETVTITRQVVEAKYQPKKPKAAEGGETRTFGLRENNRFDTAPKVPPAILVTPVGPSFRLTFSIQQNDVFELTLNLEPGEEKAHLVEFQALKQVTDQMKSTKRRREELKKEVEAMDAAGTPPPGGEPPPEGAATPLPESAIPPSDSPAAPAASSATPSSSKSP